jgi:hypothetical protein
MSINLSRNTRLWISTVNKDGTHTNANTFEIPVQEGYSFSQSVSTTDVTVEEAGATPIRGGRRFNTALDPVEWSFATYMNPYVETNHYTVDMLLWHALASSNATPLDFSTGASSEVYGDSTSFNVGFGNNSAHVLTELYLYFLVDNIMYYLDKAQVGQAEISIDISAIAMTSWSGQALTYNAITIPTAFGTLGSITAGLAFNDSAPTSDSYVAVPVVKSYLVNKLTVLDMESDVSSVSGNYLIPITSGTVTINNNVTYLTPNTLSEVDTAIGSFTGSFEVTGAIEAYQRNSVGTTGAVNNEWTTSDLLTHMLGSTGSVTNSANVVFKIGGLTGPRTYITIPTAQLSVPTLSLDDVVSTSIEFKGIPTSTELLSGTEISLQFFGA